MRDEKAKMRNERGFSVIEVMLAAALFTIFSSGIIFVVLQGLDANRLGSEETIANEYASEGIEAVRSIKNQAFSNLVDSSGTGIIKNASNVWVFGGANNTLNKYTRVITVSDVQRDGSGNIVVSGGTLDPNTKKATSTVSWKVSPTRNNSIILSTYLTNWKGSILAPTSTLTPTPTPINSCQAYCQSLLIFTLGTCRQNANQCLNNGDVYQSGGDQYCSGGSQEVCCCNSQNNQGNQN